MKSNIISVNRKKLACTAFIIFFLFGSFCSIKTNAAAIGFENGISGWSLLNNQGNWVNTISTGQFRSGASAIAGSANSNTSGVVSPGSFSVTIPNTSVQYYVTLIAWVKGSSTFSDSGLGFYPTSTGAIDYGPISYRGTVWTRVTYTIPAVAGETYRAVLTSRKSTTGSAINNYFDDVVMYYHTNSAADVIAPSKPATAKATAGSVTMPISYTTGIESETQLEGGLLLRAAGIVTTVPTLLHQTFYTSNPLLGVSSISGSVGVTWEVVENSALSGSFPNNPAFTGSYTYLLYSKDMALNYSNPARLFALNNSLVTYQVTASTNADGLYVPAGNTLEVASTVTLTLNSYSDISISGTLVNKFDLVQSLNSTLVFSNGGVYQHASSASSRKIPTANWHTGSTCLVTGVTSSAPQNLDQDYYHFTWNCPAQVASISPTLRGLVIKGDFKLISTGLGALHLADYGLNLQQNFIQTGGTMNFTGNESMLKFAGMLPQSLQKSGGTFTGTRNLTISNLLGVSLSGSASFNGNIRLQEGGLSLANGTLILENGSTVYRAYGSLTKAPIFNGAVSVVYLASQITGPELPVSATALRDLTINANGKVFLSADTHVNNNLTFSQGSLVLGTYDLSIAETGDIIGAGSTKYIVADGGGALTMMGLGSSGTSSTLLFPIGNTTSYSPAAIRNVGVNDDFSIRLLNKVYLEYLPDGTPVGNGIVRNIVNKTWLIEEKVVGGSDVSLTLYWQDTDESESFDRGQAFISHFKSNKWNATAPGTAATTMTFGPTTLHSSFTSGVNDFSPFGVGDADSPLPVELISFTAKSDQSEAVLNWVTASEKDNDHFEIQRSQNGREWSYLGSVAGSGTALQSNRYTYRDTHFNEIQGKGAYYRLKQVDTDGSSSFSPVVFLNRAEKTYNSSSAFINQDGQLLVRLNSPAEGGMIFISNILGQQISKFELSYGAMEVLITTPRLASGSYLISIYTENNLETVKLVIP